MEWGVGQGPVQPRQPDSGWEAEVLGGLLHRIGGEVAMGGGSVGKGPLEAEGASAKTIYGLRDLCGFRGLFGCR